MSRKLIEYTLVVLVAIIFSLLLIWGLIMLLPGDCVGCSVTAPAEQRDECEKQFSGTAGAPRVLQPGTVAEYQVGFYDPTMYPGGTYNPGSGYVIVRVRPQPYYDEYYGGYTGAPAAEEGQTLDGVNMAVVRYVNPLRNEYVSGCGERNVTYRDNKYEAFCNLPTRFARGDAPKKSYRIFVTNDSNVPVEYCIVSNCDESQGQICKVELPPLPTP
jgi:hypothetical protein